MTDRARELLERVIAETDSSHFYTSEIDKEIRAYLADTNPSETINSQEVDRSEPVAWTCQDELNALGTDVTCYMYAEPLVGENNIPLYLHPAPRPEFVRLSEEEVNNLLDACGVGRDWNYQLICAVENRLVEKNK